MLIGKGSIIKYECRDEGYIIYFRDQNEAVEHIYVDEIAADLLKGYDVFDVPLKYIRLMNHIINRKRGYMAHTEDNKSDDRLFRLFDKPRDVEFGEMLYTKKFFGIYECGEYFKEMDDKGNPSQYDYNELEHWDNQHSNPISYYKAH